MEKDAFTQSDVDDFLDSDVEADNYLPASLIQINMIDT